MTNYNYYTSAGYRFYRMGVIQKAIDEEADPKKKEELTALLYSYLQAELNLRNNNKEG